MAARIGINRTKETVVGSDKIVIGDSGGKVKVITDSYLLPGAVLASGDTIEFAEIPVGARVIEATISCASLGSTGVMDLGWSASTDAVEVLDANGFIDSSNAGGQAVMTKMTAALSMPGFLKKFAYAGCKLLLTCTQSSTNTAVTISVTLQYDLD